MLFTSCKSSEKAETQEKIAEKKETGEMEVLSLQKLVPNFGEPSAERSSIFDLSQTQEEILISYHFYIADLSQFDEEIGIDPVHDPYIEGGNAPVPHIVVCRICTY